MPQVILPDIRNTDNKELQMQYLLDAFYKLRKELSYVLQNLDEDNVIRAGSIFAENIDTTNAKIQVAQIEKLIAGPSGNVEIGADTTLAWEKINNKPVDLVYQAALASYVTDGELSSTLTSYLTDSELTTVLGQDYIITGKIAANQIATGTLTGVTINVTTDLNVGDNIYLGDALDTGKSIVLSSTAAISNPLGSQNMVLSAYNAIKLQSFLVDFSGAGSINWGIHAPSGTAKFV